MSLPHRSRTRSSAMISVGAVMLLVALLLTWQQVDASSCTDTSLDLAACEPVLEAEQS